MKKIVLILSLSALFAATVSAQHRADRQCLSDPASSTMILLGDPQAYVKYDQVRTHSFLGRPLLLTRPDKSGGKTEFFVPS